MKKSILFVLAFVFCGSALAAGPTATVAQTADRLYELIEEDREHYEAHPSELESLVRDILLPRVDQSYAGRLILGRHARGVPAGKVTRFSDALGDVLIKRYSRQLLEFERREQMRILPLDGAADPQLTRVQTRVQLVSGRSAAVDYVMHRTERGWQVFDVVVEGISYVVTFRTQFNDEITRHGFDRALERLGNREIQLVEAGP